MSLLQHNFGAEPLPFFSWISLLDPTLIQCFHSGQNFWLRPEILDFFEKARKRPEKPEKARILYNLPQKKPEKGQKFAKRAKIYTISQNPIAAWYGTSWNIWFRVEKIGQFSRKNDLNAIKTQILQFGGQNLTTGFQRQRNSQGQRLPRYGRFCVYSNFWKSTRI